ncbi:hypothetical protein HOP54_03220 [Halomonas daqingensis]|uniref:hypothetical protein n=1 Tax=Billgrantia desiderata TaxID=52021 RepID=UPI001F413112|nr:hypothetical protein [Halomonas desiderata]MCE8027698.1 hypothetical protein [Halomonas desiderata]
MEIGSLLSTGKAALDLVDKLSEIAQKYEGEDTSQRMASIIAELNIAAINMSRDFIEDLNGIKNDFFSSGIDIRKSMIQLNAELSWYNFLTKSKLNSYEKRFKSIYERLSGFLDDVTSVALCTDEKTPLAAALSETSERANQLNEVFDANRPLEDIFDTMQQIVRSIHDQLRGGPVAAAT